MSMSHYTSGDMLRAYDPVVIVLVGCGGTGSRVLTGLGEMNEALCSLGHVGLSVVVVDPDTVSSSNVGRASFSSVDVGSNKARVLVERVNRWYGLNWQSIPEHFNEGILENVHNTTIVISAVDNVKSRKDIFHALQSNSGCSYWIDYGNSSRSGQVILSTLKPIIQPEGGCSTLPNIFDYFPDIEKTEDVNAPSCSLPEALESQDLLVNKIVADYGLDILWQMFKYGKVENHGVFLNLTNYLTAPVTVKSSFDRFVSEGDKNDL